MSAGLPTTKPGVLAVMDRDRNDAACNRFEAANVSGQTPADRLREYEESREALATVERLAEAAANMEAVIWLWRETGQAPDFAPLTTADDALRAALAAFHGEQA